MLPSIALTLTGGVQSYILNRSHCHAADSAPGRLVAVMAQSGSRARDKHFDEFLVKQAGAGSLTAVYCLEAKTFIQGIATTGFK